MIIASNNNSMHKNRKNCIYVLALGGTIACTANQGASEFYEHPSANIGEIISSLPINDEELIIKYEQIFQQISQEMTHDDLLLLARRINELVNRDEIDGVVITQGTNCIEETAYFISLVVKTQKTIVFTGAFRPINALGYDGSRNLYNSILLASNRELCGLGVVLSFNDCIVTARDAAKLNPCLVGDLSINGAGVLGYIQGNTIHIQKVVQYKHSYQSEFAINQINMLPKVYIIFGHLGLDSIFVEAAIASDAVGIISAGMGKGYQSKEVTEALSKASRKGIFVVRCSRTGQGIVHREKSIDDKYGFIAGGSLTPQKARILLSVAMTMTESKAEVQRIFDQY